MDNAEQILKAQIGELLWNNAVLLSEYNKLKKQLDSLQEADKDKNGPAPSEPATVE